MPSVVPAPPSGARHRLKRLLSLPLVAASVVAVLVDDAFRAVVIPAVRAFARLRLIRRVEAWIATLPPYVTLALFVIPLAIIEPFKIYALYLFGEGRWIAGILTFVVAKVVGLGLAERLFAVSRDKLLSIGWFAALHRKLLGIKEGVHAWLAQTRFWPAAVRVVGRVRETMRRLRVDLRNAMVRGGGVGPKSAFAARFAAARRLVRRGGVGEWGAK